MEIQQLLTSVLKNWWLILAFVLISTGVGLMYSYNTTPVYETTATFIVNPTMAIGDTYDRIYSIDTLAGRTSLATTYSELLQSQAVAELAAVELGMSPTELEAYTRQSVALPDSVVLQLRVQGPSSQRAAALANAIGATGIQYMRQLHEMYELRQVDLAAVTVEPIAPNHIQNALLSAILGFIGGVAFSLLRQSLVYAFGETPARSVGMGQPDPLAS